MNVCVCVCGGGGGGVVFTLSVHMSIYPSVAFWFLLFIFLNNLRNLSLFCINVDIDERLLLEKNKGLWDNFYKAILFPFVILENVFWFPILILLNNLRTLFFFCINVGIDEVLLLKKNKGLGVSLCYS